MPIASVFVAVAVFYALKIMDTLSLNQAQETQFEEVIHDYNVSGQYYDYDTSNKVHGSGVDPKVAKRLAAARFRTDTFTSVGVNEKQEESNR